MADCWRHLAAAEDIELKIVIERADSGKEFAAGQTLAGLDVKIVLPGERIGLDPGGWRPDVMFAGGWRSPTTRRLAEAFPDAPKVFCLDMPYRRSVRCFVARFALWRFLRKFDAVFVPGRASAVYARWLGFPASRIFMRLYAVDQARFRNAQAGNRGTERRGFLYVGRYSPEKRVDLIEKAYAIYKECGGTWGIDYFGQGGKFAQAGEMPGIYASHACLLLASSFDPWPLVMLEAKSSGLEVIASDRCGNCGELGAVKVPYGNAQAMAEAMLRIERETRPAAGIAAERSRTLLSRYDCSAWTRRVRAICRHVRRGRFFCPGMDDIANGMAAVAKKLAADPAAAGWYVVHGAWRPPVWLHCIGAMLSGRKFARMPHGAYSPVYLSHSGKWRKRLVRIVERWLLRRADKVIVTCATEEEWIRAYEPDSKVEVVDLRRYDWGRPCTGRRAKDACSADGDGGGGETVILYLGRRHPLKGVEALEKAVGELNSGASAGSPHFKLEVVSGAYGAAKEAAFSRCDILCLPTLSENFGIVVAEAIARGKPVITTDGAPAWAGEPRFRADGSPGLFYIEGYRDATPQVRIRKLKSALMEMSEAVRRRKAAQHR